MGELHDHIRTGREPTGYAGLARSGMTAVFDNGMDGTCCISSDAGWKYQDVLFDLGVRMADLAHQDYVVKAETVADIRYAHETGRLAHVFGLEAATMIENEVDRLDVLYGFGVRQIGIAYSEANTLGSGLKERGDGGLTYFGERAVRRMNQLGLAIDISHSGDRTAMDVIRASTTPVFITHCGSREVWPTARTKPDSIITACAERGGVLGVEAAPHTTLSEKHRRHSIDSVMDHFEHVGDPGAPVLIAHHGAPGIGSRSETKGSFGALADTYRVIVFDARGSGESSDNPPYTHSQWAADVDALRAWAGVEQVVMAGGSYGGFIALEYALAYPDRVQALVLRDTAAADTFRATARERAMNTDRTTIDMELFDRSFTGQVRDNADFKETWMAILPLYDYEDDPAAVQAKAARRRSTSTRPTTTRSRRTCRPTT
ncbi:MAG: diguanylate cyclase [Modestobacter sp.]|nr:diguanylate cyclase [Modestobacter sp.]